MAKLSEHALVQTEGKWIDNIFIPGSRLFVSYDGGFESRLQELLVENRDEMQIMQAAGTEESLKSYRDKYNSLIDQAFCETKFLDFDGLEDDDGKPLKNTVENRILIVTQCKHIFKWLDNYTANFENWKPSVKDVEEVKPR